MPSLKMTSRFKIRLTGFLNAIAVIGMLVAMVMLFNIITKIDQTNTQIKRQSDQIKRQGENAARDQKIATETIERSMACLGTFFSQKDRAQLRITNIRSCTIVNDQTGEQRDLPITFVMLPPQRTTGPSNPSTSSRQEPPQSSQPQNQPQPEQPSSPPQTPTPTQPPPIIGEGVGNAIDDTLNALPPVLKEVLGIL